jgi:hypothetical protein
MSWPSWSETMGSKQRLTPAHVSCTILHLTLPQCEDVQEPYNQMEA